MPKTRAVHELFDQLACPCCERSPLVADTSHLRCTNPGCGARFPLVDGRPVLINDTNSVFSIADFERRRVTTMDLSDPEDRPAGTLGGVKVLLRRFTPPNARNVSDFPVDSALEAVAESVPGRARVLVIGAGDSRLRVQADMDVVYSDVAIGDLTDLVCDAHDIPFHDGHFDAVIAVAVMEHVVDPARCVAEIHRVLAPRGFVYAVTPFMQQVHMGRYDFQRFTHLGHRRLFRMFSEERSGVANGPGTALAWSIERFLSAFSSRPGMYAVLRTAARFVVFPFPFFDDWLAQKPASFDCASGYYFFGRRLDEPVSDTEILAGYRGIQ